MTLISTYFTFRSENLNAQIISDSQTVLSDSQTALTDIESVDNTIQMADNYINTIIPTDGTATGTKQQAITILSPSEIEKWQYINNYFTSWINDLNYFEKIGNFIKEYANFLAMPTIILHKFLAEKTISKLTSSTNTSKATASVKSKAISKTLSLGSTGITYIAAPIIGGIIIYTILKSIGAKLEHKTEKCYLALTNFVKDWDNQKDKIPTVLWNFFEQLNKELVKSSNKLLNNSSATNNSEKSPTINAETAQKIVESIITNAIIYNSINS